MNKELEKVLKSEFSDLSWPQVADRLADLRERHDQLDAQAKRIKAEMDYITINILPDRIIEEGLKGVPLSDGSRIELRSKAWCNVKAGAKERLHEWMRQNGFEELIQESINPSTLKSFIKEQMDEGHEIPDAEIVSYTPFLQATLIGRKK